MEFLANNLNALLGLIRTFRFQDFLDVALVSFIIYNGVKLVRETRAEQLVKGILVLVFAYVLAEVLDLRMLMTVLNYLFQFGVLALLVVFQPELRRALEQIGRSKIGRRWIFSSNPGDDEAYMQRCRKGLNAVVDAASSLQKMKMGALIVFEKDTKLGEIIDTGTVINAAPSSAVICNIFFNKAPLHDGALIMRDGIVYAAGCILPLSKTDTVGIDLGTRHRAAIGMSENSDAVVVVVSEETGTISVAINGILTRNYSRETLKSALEGLILPQTSDSEDKKPGIMPSIRKVKK